MWFNLSAAPARVAGLLLCSLTTFVGCGKHAPSAEDAPVLLAALRKAESAHDPVARGRAVADLQLIGGAAVPHVLPLLRDPEPSIRADGVDILTAVGEPAIKPAFALIGNVSHETDRQVAALLGNLAPKSVPFLLNELKNPDFTHHLSAAWAFAFEPRLTKLGDPALPQLVQLMHSDRDQVRIIATEAVGKIGHATGHLQRDALRAAASDRNNQVRIMASLGLQEPVTGVNGERITPGPNGAAVSNPPAGRNAVARNAVQPRADTLWPPRTTPAPGIGGGTGPLADAAATIIDGRRCDDWFNVLAWAKRRNDKALEAQATSALSKLGQKGIPLYLAELRYEEAAQFLGTLGAPAAPGLVKWLERNEPTPAVLKALGDIGQPAAAELTRLLQDPEAHVRAAKVFATEDRLAKFGDAAVPTLKRLYDQDHSGNRVQYVLAVGSIARATGHSEAEFLVKAGADRDPSVRAAAARAAGPGVVTDGVALANQAALRRAIEAARNSPAESGGKNAQALYQQMCDILKAKPYNQLTLKQTQDSLVSLGAPAVPVLISPLTGSDFELSELARQTLIRIGRPSAGPISELLGSPDEKVAQNVMIIMVALKGQAVPALRESMQSKMPRRRLAAVRALMNIPPEAAAEAMPDLSAAGNDPDPQVREWAMRATARMPSARTSAKAADGYRAGMASDNVEVRRGAVEGLKPSSQEVAQLDFARQRQARGDDTPAVRAEIATGEAKFKRLVPDLIVALGDSDSQVRQSAAAGLAQIGPPAADAIPMLARLANTPEPEGRSSDIRSIAFAALGKIGPAAVPALISSLDGPDEISRGSAAHYLGEIGQPAHDAVPALVKHLNAGESKDTQKKIFDALGKIGPAAAGALPMLEQIAVANDSERASLAKEAIRHINFDRTQRPPSVWKPLPPSGTLATPPRFPDAAAMRRARTVLDEMARDFSQFKGQVNTPTTGWYVLALRYARLGDLDAATAALHQAPVSAPGPKPTFEPTNDVRFIAEAALGAARAGDLHTAAERWAAALEILKRQQPQPGEWGEWRSLAVAHVRAHDLPGAADVVENAPTRQAKAAVLTYVVGQCISANDLPNAAAAAMAIDEPGSRAPALAMVGSHLEDAGNAALALKCYRAALEPGVSAYPYCRTAIEGEVRLGQTAEAVKAATTYRGFDRDEILLDLITLLCQRGDVNSAAIAFSAMSNNPNDPRIRDLRPRAQAILNAAATAPFSGVTSRPAGAANPASRPTSRPAPRQALDRAALISRKYPQLADAAAQGDTTAIDRELARVDRGAAPGLMQDVAEILILRGDNRAALGYLDSAMAVTPQPPDQTARMLLLIRDADIRRTASDPAAAARLKAVESQVLQAVQPMNNNVQNGLLTVMVKLADAQAHAGNDADALKWVRQMGNLLQRQLAYAAVVDALLQKATGENLDVAFR